jgi:pyridoxal phosphate enzyme (YggS family)
MGLADNLANVLSHLPSKVTLVAVSKTKPVSLIKEAYDAGQRIFGENRALELRDKHEELPEDIEWHMIGHLQSNKVKNIAPFVNMIHGVESSNLLVEIDRRAKQHNRTIKCLLQFHIASESTKFGLDLNEAREILKSQAFAELKNVDISGVMGMATFTDDHDQIRAEFRQLKVIFETLKEEFFRNDPAFSEISMGMSGDYVIAIEEGSTMVRVGSSIFGARG